MKILIGKFLCIKEWDSIIGTDLLWIWLVNLETFLSLSLNFRRPICSYKYVFLHMANQILKSLEIMIEGKAFDDRMVQRYKLSLGGGGFDSHN